MALRNVAHYQYGFTGSQNAIAGVSALKEFLEVGDAPENLSASEVATEYGKLR